jgi:enoyl-CoA hydratase
MIGQRRDGDVAVIEIDRHERRNALDAAHCDGLAAAVREQAAGGARVPVIAAVNGPAIGAGAQVALACDLRVAAPAAAFAIPAARLGLAVDPWTIRRLAAVAGGGTAQAVSYEACWASGDRAEGQRARADKRPPRFLGR